MSDLVKAKRPTQTENKHKKQYKWRKYIIKGCLWLTRGLIILEMKADSELAIGRNTGHHYMQYLLPFTR